MFTMKILSGIFYVISICVTAGHCLMCVECESSGEQCTGEPKECISPSDICMSQYSETNDNEIRVNYFSRFCGSSRNCDQYRSIATRSWNQRSRSTCCKSDSCTPSFPTLPPQNVTDSGKRCPTCISWESHTCVPMAPLICTGAKTQCVNVNQTRAWTFSPMKSVLYTLVGCGTKNLCEYGSSTYYNDVITHVDASCIID